MRESCPNLTSLATGCSPEPRLAQDLAAHGRALQAEVSEHVARRDLEGLAGRNVSEQALGERPRVRPVALDVREIGGEHDALNAHVVSELDGHSLDVLHAEEDVLADVVARPLLER